MENNIFTLSEVIKETTEKVLSGKPDNPKNQITVNEDLAFRKGELVVLASRPSIGKTAFALSLLRKLAFDSNASAGFCSLGDVNRRQIGMRLLSQVAEIVYTKIISGSLKKEESKKLMLAADELSKAPVFVSDEKNVSLTKLKSIIKRMAEQQKTQLVFIGCLGDILECRDFFDTCFTEESHDITDSCRLVVSDILDSMKQLATDLNLSVVLLMNLFRTSSGTVPSIRSFKGLSGIVRDKADEILLLDRLRVPEHVFCTDYSLKLYNTRLEKADMITGNYIVPYRSFEL